MECGAGGSIRIRGGTQLIHFIWIDQEKYIYYIKVIRIRARGLASALHKIQGDASGPRSGKRGPRKGTNY